jgi:hypothetical protein
MRRGGERVARRMESLTRSALPSSLFALFIIRGGEVGLAEDDPDLCFALIECQTAALIDMIELYFIACLAC